MHILSNAFPTNMPDAEKVSQGGPANFARLFVNYIVSEHPEHRWTGVMMEGVNTQKTWMSRVFSTKNRDYYRLFTSRRALHDIARSSKTNIRTEETLREPIDRLVKFVRKQKPDIVFLNGFGLLNWMLLKAAEQAGVPVVIQHAGIWSKEVDIHKDLYPSAGRKRMKQMEKDSTRLSAIEIFLNTWSGEYYQRKVAKNTPEKLRVIPLPFDFPSFRQLGVHLESQTFTFDAKKAHVGVIARWDEIKNHKAILALAKKARAQSLPLQFHSVVDIPHVEKYEKERKAYTKYVDVIPPMDRAGISAFCRSVDMLFLPSLFDVSPTVVLEAIASGTPIAISPTIGYVHDFTRKGAKQWVVDPKDIQACLKQLTALAKKKMPASICRHLEKNHDHQFVFEQYLEVFQSAIMKHRHEKTEIKKRGPHDRTPSRKFERTAVA